MDLGALEERLGHHFGDREYLQRALVHRSWVAESDEQHSNERLEFLGDAVLGCVIADLVFHRHVDLAEGRLTDLRKGVVNGRALAEIATEIGLGGHLCLGRGEDAAGGRQKVSILADALEAVLGAVYLDGGIDAVRPIIDRLFGPHLLATLGSFEKLDYKSALQELAAERGLPSPDYRVRSSGPDHDKMFFATVKIAKRVYGSGEGRSKKSAEQVAAGAAYVELESG